MKLGEFLKLEPQVEKLLLGMPEEIKHRSFFSEIAAGKTIVRKEQKAEYVYILLKGEVKITNEFADGKIYTFARVRSIKFIGELEVLAEKKEYASTVETAVNSKVLRISVEDFLKWIKCDYEILLMVSKLLAQNVYLISRDNGTIKFLSSIQKLQIYIVKYYKKNRTDMDLIYINRKRQQITEEIGISIKTVDRCIEKLRKENLIYIKKGKIFLDNEQFAKLCAIVNRFCTAY